MGEYKEFVNSFQTEVGQVDIIHIWEDDSKPEDVEIQVWVNKSRIHLPESILKQTSQTVIKKVCRLVKSAAAVGVRIGGEI